MFHKIIQIKRIEDIRYGHTNKSFSQSLGEIMALLEKHGCQQIATVKDGTSRMIGFVYQEKPYRIDIPQVYVKGVLNENIGIRVVKYYLEIILELSKQRVMDFDLVMLGTRMVDVNGKISTLRDAIGTLPVPLLVEGSFKSGEAPKNVG